MAIFVRFKTKTDLSGMLRLIRFFIWILIFVEANTQDIENSSANRIVNIVETDSLHGITVFLNDSIKFEMVLVDAGSFMMGYENGYSNEKPLHKVTLDEYYIGKFEVSQKIWQMVTGKNPAHFNDCPDCPVEMISYEDAISFIDRLNQLSGKSFRLPTEAEWEYAAKGGSTKKKTRYSGSNKIDEVAWYSKNAVERPHAVGLKLPNALGIFDMSGNVFEWTNDWMGRYKHNDQINPKGAAKGKTKVVRGGCWYDTNDGCRIHCRVEVEPSEKNGCLGLRLALDGSFDGSSK
jgi:formylglycine-generating enzyme required for sulfatase activity